MKAYLGLIWVVLWVVEGVVGQYIVTLNETQQATLYCYSNYLVFIRIVPTSCLTSNCSRVHLDDGASDPCVPGEIRSRPCLECIDNCNKRWGMKAKRCDSIPGEHSICLDVTSNLTTSQDYTCVGITHKDGFLTVNTSVIRHEGSQACYNSQDYHGEQHSDRRKRNEINSEEEDDSFLRNVTYNTALFCVNESKVQTLDAGHLLNMGYTLVRPREEDRHELEHEENVPQFEPFCQVELLELWRYRQGDLVTCNGSYHYLADEFPCLQFTPFKGGFRLPSLENCSEIEMVGIVIAMIIAMFVCYGVLLVIAQVWNLFCKCRHRKDEIEDSSTMSRPPTQFSSKSVAALSVVKQQSGDSILSQRSTGTVAPSNGGPTPSNPVTATTSLRSDLSLKTGNT